MVRKVLLLVLLISLVSSFALAQEPASTPEPSSGDTAAPADDAAAIASGLNNPRHITFAADGTLYIAEAGTGGDVDAEGPFGPVKAGETAQISAVSPDGEQSVPLPGLISMDNG